MLWLVEPALALALALQRSGRFVATLLLLYILDGWLLGHVTCMSTRRLNTKCLFG